MIAGRLRHRITIQRKQLAQDPDTGEMVLAWQDLAVDEPASVVPLSGREYIQSQANQSELTARITIRYFPGVNSTQRVLFDGGIYSIEAVLPDPTARRHLTLMCKEVSGTDGQ